MRIAVLTSSRADYGIYLPLLKTLEADPETDLRMIVFGTHLSRFHGYTIDAIHQDGFNIDYEVESLLAGDSEEAIATAVGLTLIKFAAIWAKEKHNYDVVVCLGDRYEMFAAVMAGIPFNIRFAHIHGGETTLGAIDNIYRHAITQASVMHFTSTDAYAQKVREMTGAPDNIYNVGALSLDNVQTLQLLTKQEFAEKWHIDLNKPTVLVTFHPETVSPDKNQQYTHELCDALLELNNYQVVITMPNSDTAGSLVRQILNERLKNENQIFLVENFGIKGYFTIMKYCSFLLGNTSSGILEAASFGKYVINIGDRQKGRASGVNIVHVPVTRTDIVKAVRQIESKGSYDGVNIYWNGGAAKEICLHLKELN